MTNFDQLLRIKKPEELRSLLRIKGQAVVILSSDGDIEQAFQCLGHMISTAQAIEATR